MTENPPKISNAFQAFQTEAPLHAQAWAGMVQNLVGASSLDKKTGELAYLAVLAVLRNGNGIPFHVKSAKQAGATRQEVISAILIGLPTAGSVVTEVLPLAVASYDEA
jgi:alkylhydroperoxidase/carboxymuconolactone decarboxylase family protein YurZ